jgi:hypothetical protein
MSSSSSVSSTSSYIASLAQVWSEQLSSRERQIAHEESREAITHDSITCLPYDKPLVDPCGHTFDRGTIKQFKRLSANTVECPISRMAVRIDQYVPNFYAENVLNYFGEETRRSTMATTTASGSSISTISTTGAAGEFVPSTPFEKYLTDQFTTIKTDMANIKKRLVIKDKQLDSVLNMSHCDHIKAMLPCSSHMKTVRDRTLTPEEKEFLRQ